jgi:hypothetical protein
MRSSAATAVGDQTQRREGALGPLLDYACTGHLDFVATSRRKRQSNGRASEVIFARFVPGACGRLAKLNQSTPTSANGRVSCARSISPHDGNALRRHINQPALRDAVGPVDAGGARAPGSEVASHRRRSPNAAAAQHLSWLAFELS